jgi:hypothetical protein
MKPMDFFAWQAQEQSIAMLLTTIATQPGGKN